MTTTFIAKAKLVHGDKYDYSKVVYENNLKEVIINCKDHGEFLQLPKTHKRGNGCIQCGTNSRATKRTKSLSEFIYHSKEVHGDKYDYSNVKYTNSSDKITIRCKLHGDFLQTPSSHIQGNGCKKCAIIYTSNLQRSDNIKFIKDAKEVHGDKYDYSKVNYINSKSKVKIICKEHGEIEQIPFDHLKGHGCPNCSRLIGSIKRTKPFDTFIKDAQEIYGNKYDYSNSNYVNVTTSIIIICKEHGEFEQTPYNHVHSKIGCPNCVYNHRFTINTSNTIQFIQNSVEIHGNKYDYSKIEYKKANEKVTIICSIHGEFQTTPASHLHQKSGCNYCGKLSRKEKQQFTKEQFIEKSMQVHGNSYDYSKVKYNNNNTKVLLICYNHGEFEQTPQGHLSGRGCIKCANKHQHTTEEWIIMAQQIHGNTYDYSNVNYKSANDTICITCKLHGNFEQLPRVHLRPNGCYKCSQKSYSKKQIQWLECISKIKGIQIQHAMNESEYTIPSTNLKADGFCKETNTIYEFHGDFWHGNPKLYNSEHINPVNKKTFGELYQQTIARESQIKELGYNLIVLWEYDWNKAIKTIRCLQQQFRYLKTHK